MLKFCEFDAADMSLTLPLDKHVKEEFKRAELLDALSPGEFLHVVVDDLGVGYPFQAGDVVSIYLQYGTLTDLYPVTFTRKDIFRRQVYSLPQEAGDYVVLYNSGDAYNLNQEIGYDAFDSGCIVLKAPVNSNDLGALGLGSVTYGVLIEGIKGTPSEYNIEPPENDIFKLIDGRDDTFWIHHILTSTKKTSGAISRVKLTYDGMRSINYIELIPVNQYPVDIIGVSYINDGDVETDLRIGVEKFERLIRISFEEVMTRGFVIYFGITSFEYSTFLISDNPNLDYAMRGYKTLEPQDLYPYLETTNFRDQKALVGPVQNNEKSIFYYQYTLGLANATSGIRKYDVAGVYLSDPIKIDSPGFFKLEATEIGNPLKSVWDTQLQSANLKGGFEYYIIKKDYDKDSKELVGVAQLPICPYNTEKVIERLYYLEGLVDNYNGLLLKTTFRAHDQYDNRNATELELYRNGTKLTRGTYHQNVTLGVPEGDYFIIDLADTYSIIGLNKRLSNGTLVRYTSDYITPQYLEPEIYEAIYIPWYACTETSHTLKVADEARIPVLAKTSDFTFNSDHTINCLWTTKGREVYSQIMLKIIIRNNSYDTNAGAENLLHCDLTPKIKSFKLGIGKVDPLNRYNSLG